VSHGCVKLHIDVEMGQAGGGSERWGYLLRSEKAASTMSCPEKGKSNNAPTRRCGEKAEGKSYLTCILTPLKIWRTYCMAVKKIVAFFSS
jgi:hypothetical protein